MRTNKYLIVKPETKLLTVVSSEKFEQIKYRVLTWFIWCEENFNDVVFDECTNCDFCLAGSANARFYYDNHFKVIMHVPEAHRSQRHHKVDITLISETGNRNPRITSNRLVLIKVDRTSLVNINI